MTCSHALLYPYLGPKQDAVGFPRLFHPLFQMQHCFVIVKIGCFDFQYPKDFASRETSPLIVGNTLRQVEIEADLIRPMIVVKVAPGSGLIAIAFLFFAL